MSETRPRIDFHYHITNWARRVSRHRVAILLLTLLLTAISIVITTRLRFNSDLANLLPEENAALQILRRIQKHYAADTGFMVLLSKNRVFAVEQRGTIRMHDGERWIRWPGTVPLHAIWGLSVSQVFAAGEQGKLVHYDGKSWQSMESGTRVALRGLWGDRLDRLYAVGDQGTVLRYDGKRWASLTKTSQYRRLRAVFGHGERVFAVGDQGTILRINGDQIVAETSNTTANLFGVFVTTEGQTFAVGDRGTLLESDGDGQWQPTTPQVSSTLRAVWGTSAKNVLAVGDRGVVLRFDGKRWQRELPGTRHDLLAVHGTTERDLWAVGTKCAIRRFEGRWVEGPHLSWEEHQKRTTHGPFSRLFSAVGSQPDCTARIKGIFRPLADMSAAKALAPRIAAALEKSPDVGRVEYRKPVQFFFDRALLYASVEELQTLHDRLEASLEHETAKASGLYVDLEREENAKGKEELGEIAARVKDRAASLGVGTDSWLIHPDGTSLGLVVYPAKSGSDFEYLRRLWQQIEQIVARFDVKAADPLLRLDVSGDGVSKIREYDASVADIFGLAPYAILGILLLMVIYFRSPVGLLFVVLPLGMSICWTFALTTLFIGTLNLITGFLFAVLFGLGIDYGLQLFARYREGRSAGLSVEDAKGHMILDTGRATITSAITTAAALLSLTLTEFKGFSEFGFIAGIGVLLAMLSFILVMPALISWAEAFGLLRFSTTRASAKTEAVAPGSEPFTFPRAVVYISAVFTLLGIYGASQLTFEYNLHNLRPAHHEDEVRRRTGSTLGRSFTPTLMVADSREQLEAAIGAIHDRSEALAARSKLRNVVSLLSFLPERQHEKRVVLDDLEQLLGEKRWDLVSDETRDRIQLDRLRKLVKAQPFAIEDLPRAVRRGFRGPGFGNVWLAMVFHKADLRKIDQAAIFREQFGTIAGRPFVNLGNLMPEGAQAFVSGDRAEIRCLAEAGECVEKVKASLGSLRHEGRPVFARVLDARAAYREKLAVSGGLRGQLLATVRPKAFALRPTRGQSAIEPSGTFHVSNAELVLHEVVRVLLKEGRFAFVVAFLAIFFAALLDLRNLKLALLAILPLGVGFLWTFEVMHLLGFKLNMFNFVILLALLGIGVDYGVHYVHRYQSEGPGALGRVMRALYWVLFFCALTTIVSFGNLALAGHPGLKSLGQLAIIGLTCVFFASTYTLPAVLFMLERWKGSRPMLPILTDGEVVIYAVSFCPACHLVRRLLSDHDVPFACLEIDTLPEDERRQVAAFLLKQTSTDTLPLTRIGSQFVVGFAPDELLSGIAKLSK